MVIGGNHDWVFQSLGPETVQRSLAEYCGDSFIYLGAVLILSALRCVLTD